MAERPTIIASVAEMGRRARQLEREGKRIGLVPTMGYLHEGHLSLVRRASELADCVVVSIYVNPTQFGPNEDLDAYPRDIESDLSKLASLGVAIVFMPDDRAMYPPGFATRVRVEGLTTGLCGRSRPTHFEGVTTIVTKLFHIVRPAIAVFGQKDYQQLAVIRRMARDLDMDVDVVGAPTVREPDGLAMSSRNAYLTAEERRAAPALHRALVAVRDRYRTGERSASTLLALAREIIESEGPLEIDYLELIDPDDLRSLPDEGDDLPERVHMALAVFAGAARLIDNMRISEDR